VNYFEWIPDGIDVPPRTSTAVERFVSLTAETASTTLKAPLPVGLARLRYSQ